ncbi:MAG: TlpA family protein disulfide reductase [Candidatus Cryptobacteroides sp.]
MKQSVMRRFIILLPIVALFMFLPQPSRGNAECAVAAEPQDSTAMNLLGAKLEEYVKTMAHMSIADQEAESDFLISTCRDSLTRQYVALWLYRHFRESKVMGVEAVAVHIVDKWFIPGEVKMSSDIEMMDARIFADFNRESLVGKPAPRLILRDRSGNPAPLFPESPSRRPSVLFFYDTGCPNCLAQTILLRNLMQEENPDVDFSAVFVGTDSLSWDSYVEERFRITAPDVRLRHLWDPGMDSDFQRKYGVLKTPAMFLVDADGIIRGRKLDAGSLMTMLRALLEEDEYQYGGPDSDAFFRELFGTLQEGFSVADVTGLIDIVAGRSADEPGIYRQMTGDLLHYLSYQRDGRYKEGCKYLIDNHIFPRREVWRRENDSLMVLSFAHVMDDILSRAMPGSLMPEIKVKGVMCRGGVPDSALELPDGSSGRRQSGKESLRNIRTLKAGTYVLFYSRSCSDCRENLVAADSLMRKDRKMRFFIVDMTSAGPDEDGSGLFDAFDLSSLPYAVQVGKNGLVSARYIDFRRLDSVSRNP